MGLAGAHAGAQPAPPDIGSRGASAVGGHEARVAGTDRRKPCIMRRCPGLGGNSPTEASILGGIGIASIGGRRDGMLSGRRLDRGVDRALSKPCAGATGAAEGRAPSLVDGRSCEKLIRGALD